MKSAILGYDQKFFINGTQLSGVQGVNGSYNISEKPINILGWGHVDEEFGIARTGFMREEIYTTFPDPPDYEIGEIYNTYITNGGVGYPGSLEVELVGGGGENAELQPMKEDDGGVVDPDNPDPTYGISNFIILDRGEGYTSNPEIRVKAGTEGGGYGFEGTAISFLPTDEINVGFILNEDGFSKIVNEDSCLLKDHPFTSLAVLNAPLEGSFSVNSVLVSEDFFIKLTGDTPFTGSIHHGNKFFGFSSGYITNHTVSCSIGQIPTTSTTIRVFGDIGGGEKIGPTAAFSANGQGASAGGGLAYIPDFDASGSNLFPDIKIPNQGSISVQCSGASTDRVISFSHNIQIPISPIYTIGSSVAAQVDVVWPMTTTTTFTLDVDKYSYRRLRKYLTAPVIENIAININDCFGLPVQEYKVRSARLLGESISASAQGRLTVNLQYKSYNNRTSKAVTSEPPPPDE